MPAVPAIIGAGGAIGSSLIGSHAASEAMKLTPEERRAYDAQSGLADQMKSQGTKLFGTAMPALQNTLSYYQTLMGRGGRSAADALTAPARENVSSVYKGAARGLVKSGVQGGARDTALADLNREKAGQMSRLVTGVQGNAAQAQGGLAGNLIGSAGGFESGAGSLYGNMGDVAGKNKRLGLETGGKTASGFGGLMAQLMNIYGGSKGKGATGKFGGITDLGGVNPFSLPGWTSNPG
jgi:hypothetical protein